MTEATRFPSVFQLRVVIRGVSPLIWRRLLVRSDTTLAELHTILQVAFGWDDDVTILDDHRDELSALHPSLGTERFERLKLNRELASLCLPEGCRT